jgi:hypothetical protein
MDMSSVTIINPGPSVVLAMGYSLTLPGRSHFQLKETESRQAEEAFDL